METFVFENEYVDKSVNKGDKCLHKTGIYT